MELIKENESYKIKDTKENGWVINGTVNKNINNSFNVNFSVSNPSEELHSSIGDGYYNMSAEGRVNSSFNVDVKNETEFIDYIQASILLIKEQLSAK